MERCSPPFVTHAAVLSLNDPSHKVHFLVFSVVFCELWLRCSQILSHIPDSLLIARSQKWLHAGPRWLCQVVGGVVIHSAASLILLWGGFPCQEAPAWPSAHQPHLAPAYRRPTAHALALRVGGESRLAGLGTDTFWQKLLSPHSTEWSADCSAEHKRPKASIASSCGLQACAEMLASVLLETVTVFLTDTALQFIPYLYDFFYRFKPSLTLNSSRPSALFAQGLVLQQPVVKAVDHGHPLIQWTSSTVIMRTVQVTNSLAGDTALIPPQLFPHSGNNFYCR